MYSIAAASIIAKMTRDRIMTQHHLSFPLYNFAQHKGYPTLEHRNALLRHGPCAIHRLTFGPVKASIKDEQPKNRKRPQKAESKVKVKVAYSMNQARLKVLKKRASKASSSACVDEPSAPRRSMRLLKKYED